MAGSNGNFFTVYCSAMLPFFAYAGALLRLRTAPVSDRRITMIGQVVSGIRVIKTNAWEDEYREKIKSVRR